VAQTLPLEAIPNQSFFVRLEDVRYFVELKEAGGMMTATIDRAGVRLVTGVRCAAGTPLLPYRYLEAGNFVFVADPGVIPYFTDFDSSCQLVYLTAAEVADARV
jgi:hypothetical protein